eukprot:3477190-Amphidinium_carterae.1
MQWIEAASQAAEIILQSFQLLRYVCSPGMSRPWIHSHFLERMNCLYDVHEVLASIRNSRKEKGEKFE